MPQTDKVAAFYEARAAIYELMITLNGHRRALRRFFLSSSYVCDGCRILDAGCGSGALLDAVHDVADRRGVKAEFYGFDLTPAMLRRALRRSSRRTCHTVRLMPADVRQLPGALPDSWRGVDAVVSSGMLEYLPKSELAGSLEKLAAMLKPGGSLVFFISRHSPFNRFFLKGIWKAHLYSEAELRRAVADAGLTLRTIATFRSWGYVVETVKNGASRP